MSEEKAPYGKPHINIPDFKEMKRIINEDNGESRLSKINPEEFPKLTDYVPKTECLCDNYSELKSVAEEMAEKLSVVINNYTENNLPHWLLTDEYWELKSALEKFDKLKEK